MSELPVVTTYRSILKHIMKKTIETSNILAKDLNYIKIK